MSADSADRERSSLWTEQPPVRVGPSASASAAPQRALRPERGSSPARPTIDEAPDGAAPDEDGEENGADFLRAVVEWVAVIVGAFVVALLIKAYLFQPFYIPSGSMSPTLQEDDRVLVNKLSYDLHPVNRGDIVVFERPQNLPAQQGEQQINDLIKRVVALAGETVENTTDGQVLINGRLLDEPYLPPGTATTNIGHVPGCINPPEESTKCTIPPGHVFVLGDNRGQSSDGRVFGPISEDLIVGRAFLRVWPVGDIGFL